MASQLQLRRGTKAQNDVFTGADGEVTINTDSKSLHSHDGVRAGGYEIGLVQANGMADLRTHTPAIGARRYLTHHTTEGDGGHGVFRAVIGGYVATQDNNGTVIVVGANAWVRELDGYVTPEMFGIDGVDDTAAIQNAVNSNKPVVLSSSVYLISSTISLPASLSLLGAGIDNTFIRMKSTSLVSAMFSAALFTGVKISNITFDCQIGSIFRRVLGVTGTSTQVEISHCKLQFLGASGTGTTSNGLSFASTVKSINIHDNLFLNGWIDVAINAASQNDPNLHNVGSMVSINGGSHVSVIDNEFYNVDTCVYADNINYLEISRNTVDKTGNTAIFDRCTAGVSKNKEICDNILHNIGKSAIKTLDSNNLNAKGHNSIVSGNIITDYGIILNSPAIMALNYFDFGATSVYLKAPAGSQASNLVISDNIISLENETVANTSIPISVANTFGVQITGNVITDKTATHLMQFVGSLIQWCGNLEFSNNIVKAPASNISFYANEDGIIINANRFTSNSYLKLDNQSALVHVTNNFIENLNATQTIAFGIYWINNNTYGEAVISGNTFKTAIAYQDNVNSTNVNMIRQPSTTSVIVMDNNLVKFSDFTKTQCTALGDIRFPVHYGGARGNAIFNSVSSKMIISKDATRLNEGSVTVV